MPMPKLPLETMLAGCNPSDEFLVRACFVHGRLRARKPYARPTTIFAACANYVWRHLCFHCVASRPHCCMPVMANHDLYAVTRNLPDKQSVRRDNLDHLDGLVRRLVHALPLSYQAGTLRWGRSLGFNV